MKPSHYIILVLAILFYQQASGQNPELEKNFKSPPSEYSLLPFWSWNGTLIAEELTRQIDEMLDKGIHGAFMHARSGLEQSETPYFSDGFWKAMDTTVHYGAAKGFLTCLYDEDKWPSGSAGGRTIAANPDEFIKKGLFFRKMEVIGPQQLQLHLHEKPLAVFAGKTAESGAYNFQSQIELTGKSTWNVPFGRWTVISFEVAKDPHEQIDYLDEAAVAKFIEITHEEYLRRYGQYFGTTIPGIFFDEIYANFSRMGDNMFWTDDFLQKFKSFKGYDLLEKLPLMVLHDPKHSAQVRHDFFDVVRELYTKAWFRQYADWCETHGIWATGHTAEKLLHYRREADYFSTIGQLQVPGADNEEYRYAFPRQIDWYNTKQISSIGNLYNRKRVMVEAMGGGGYTIPLEEYRYGFAMLGAYGVNMFVPHLFHYSTNVPESQADWPPSWFFQNPYWKYFRPLAEFGARISYMISQGNEVCDVAVLYPLSDAWADGYPGNPDDQFYCEVQQELMNKHINYNVIDPQSLSKAKLSGQYLNAGRGKYRILILPGIRTIRQDVMQQISRFVEQGGTVIGLGSLPVLSENGPEGDELVNSTVRKLFGFPGSVLNLGEYYKRNVNLTENYTAKANQKGMAFFSRYTGELSSMVNACIEPDVRVLSQNAKFLRVHHRSIGKQETFLLVNDRNVSEKYHLSLNSLGTPALWNPETGEIHAFGNYSIRGKRMEFVMDIKARGAYFLVLDTDQPVRSSGLVQQMNLIDYQIIRTKDSLRVEGWAVPGQTNRVILTNQDHLAENKWENRQVLKEIPLGGEWQFQLAPKVLDKTWSDSPEADTLPLPVMQFRIERKSAQGIRNRQTTQDEENWETVKIVDEFNRKPGIQRYLSAWDACWISYYDPSRHLPEIEGGDHCFQKEIQLDGEVKEARIAITADSAYKLFINNQEIGADADWETTETYTVTDFLVPGKNSLLVKTSDTRGLLMQGQVHLKNGKQISLQTDTTWRVDDNRQAFGFASPPMGKWGNLPNPLQKLEFPVTVWYQQKLPPGAVALKSPKIKGTYDLFINGREIKFDPDKDVTDIRALLKKEDNLLSVRVKATDKSGGLIEPIAVVCKKTNVDLRFWHELGLEWYSGRAVYSKEADIPASYLGENIRLLLDPGQVNYFAEIWVNGKLVTFRPWPPFETDITAYIKPGKNRITLVVSNLLANQATWNILDDNLSVREARWWHQGHLMREKEKLVSGLGGPVRIIPLVKEFTEFGIQAGESNETQ